jgi:hypothetical protein
MKNLFALLMIAGTLSIVACSPKAEENKTAVATDSVKTETAAPTASADSVKTTTTTTTTTTPAPAEKK